MSVVRMSYVICNACGVPATQPVMGGAASRGHEKRSPHPRTQSPTHRARRRTDQTAQTCYGVITR